MQMQTSTRREWLIFAAAITLVTAIPWFVALSATPAGGLYLGSTLSTDDHMVYAAWMHQAKSGHFFFDNRFTTASQPALTVHLYFWVLGLIAKVTGIPVASTLGRLVFTFLFTLQLARFVERFGWSARRSLVMTVFVVFAGGFGFLVWHNFKGEITLPVPAALNQLLLGRLPMDVKQPEAFIFPSMLNNGLFMVSMWLILVVLQAVIDARESSKGLWVGFAAMAVLMNIHSYDVLLVGLVLGGFLAGEIRHKDITIEWVKRVAVIMAGLVIPAIWFVHVLKSDSVFQARAATETYSLNFRPVLFGLLPLILLGLRSLWPADVKARPAFFTLCGGLVVLFIAADQNAKGYFLGWPAWVVAFGAAIYIVWSLSAEHQRARNLIVAWAVVGLVAMYVPQLFQRKLAEGIVIPWALLAMDGLVLLLKGRDESMRQLCFAAAGIVCGASSLRWLMQELTLQRMNVSTTTVHAPFLSDEELSVVNAIDRDAGRKVVIAMPGVPSIAYTDAGADSVSLPDAFLTPQVNDLNPVLSGLAGAYSIAGHWSETPDYNEQRKQVQRLFVRDMPEPETRAELTRLGVTHIVVRLDGLVPRNQSLVKMGKPIYQGKHLAVIRVER